MPPEPVPADPRRNEDPARYAAEPEGPWWEDDGEDPPGEDQLTAEELAEIREAVAGAAAFGSGMALDVMPGCPELALFADAAAGAGDSFGGVSDAELIGVLGAWDRLEAHVAARKLAAVASASAGVPSRGARRRGRRGCRPGGMSSPPASWPARWRSPAAAPMTC